MTATAQHHDQFDTTGPKPSAASRGECLTAAERELLEQATEFHRHRLLSHPSYQPQDDPQHISTLLAEYLSERFPISTPMLHLEVAQL